MIETVNYRSACVTDAYICKGGGPEVWEPRFTYRGFRYAQVTGLPLEPSPETIVSQVLHTAAPMSGTFECSDPLINPILKNVVWGQRSNMHSVLTDCPQRDERLGWMGDAQAFAPTSIWNMDMALFFTKWMRDIVDSQHENGATTGVCPRIVVDGAGRAAWADAVTIIPWQVYRYYGDTRILEEPASVGVRHHRTGTAAGSRRQCGQGCRQARLSSQHGTDSTWLIQTWIGGKTSRDWHIT